MVSRNNILVSKKGRKERIGRGFSKEELGKAGLTLNQALRAGLPVDTRRRSAHDENVKVLEQQMKNRASDARKSSASRKKGKGSQS